MEIKLARSELLKQLQLIQGVVERKTTMPILNNVLFEAKGKNLTTTATDLEVGITSTCPAEVLREGKVTVHARGLYDIVKELPEELVHVCVKENFWLEILCGRSQFKVVGLSPEEFPALPKKGDGASQKMECKDLLQMIAKTAFAMSTDETRYNLNGVLLEPTSGEKPTIRMVATDGHRLSIVDRQARTALKLQKGVILPRKGIAELKKLAEAAEEGATLELWIDSKHVIAYRGNATLIVRLIDGQFPPYQQVVPPQSKRIVSVDRHALCQALRRVSAMTSERMRGVKFSISPKHVEVSSSNPDFGEAREDVTATYRGESFEIGFNARYFLDALLALEDDQAVLALGDDTAPCVLKSEFDRGFTHVIMPMRL